MYDHIVKSNYGLGYFVTEIHDFLLISTFLSGIMSEQYIFWRGYGEDESDQIESTIYQYAGSLLDGLLGAGNLHFGFLIVS